MVASFVPLVVVVVLLLMQLGQIVSTVVLGQIVSTVVLGPRFVVECNVSVFLDSVTSSDITTVVAFSDVHVSCFSKAEEISKLLVDSL